LGSLQGGRVARTILVADDSPTIQKRAQGILKGEGYEVETVSNGVAAIKKLASLQPIVVLADVSMPGRDGYEVCDFVKTSEALRHVPVLLIASDLEPYDEGRGARVHADGKVKKPFEPQDLISVVARFAAQAEEAAPKAPPVQPVAPPLPPAFEVAATEEELEAGARKQGPMLAGVSEGIAFAEPPAEEVHAALPELTPEPPPVLAPEPAATATIRTEAAPEVAGAAAIPVEAAPPPAELAAPPVEPAPPAVEPGPEEVSVQAEPVLVEEPDAAPPEERPVPITEQTVMFRAPAQIAEPVLSEEGVMPPGEEPAPAQEEPTEGMPVTATSLDSFSLSEAATGQVRISPLEAEVPPEVVPEAPQPVSAAPQFDFQLVYSIVHKAVVRMSPPAFSAAMIEEMARRLAEEIIAELQAESSQTQ
jgi:CheY-like chemotaxis protein